MCAFASADEIRQSQQEKKHSAEGSERAYVIGHQNLIQVKIFGEAGVQQIFRVDELGFITHPLLGRVRIAGLTVAEAEGHFIEKLEGDYIINPNVTIFILEHSRFSVMGEVRRAGTYELMGNVSLIEAVSMAGGFTPVANQHDVKILRQGENGEVTIKVDAGRIINQGDSASETRIQADDVIVVQKSFF